MNFIDIDYDIFFENHNDYVNRKYLHLDYNKINDINFNKLNTKDIINYVCLIDSYIFNNFGNDNKNNLFLQKLFDELSNRINNLLIYWCDNANFFKNEFKIIYDKNNNMLHSEITLKFINMILSLYDVFTIDTFTNSNKLLILLTMKIKEYFIKIIDKLILNMIEKLNKLEDLVGLANDLVNIQNIKNQINLKGFEENQIEKNQIENEFGEINYQISLQINKIFEKITLNIMNDFEEIEVNKYNGINEKKNSSIKIIDIILVTMDDYLCDLKVWMLKPNLLAFLEKIHLTIINSDLIEKFSESRDRFEEYIRINIDFINGY
jgi:hypothetical protein